MHECTIFLLGHSELLLTYYRSIICKSLSGRTYEIMKGRGEMSGNWKGTFSCIFFCIWIEKVCTQTQTVVRIWRNMDFWFLNYVFLYIFHNFSPLLFFSLSFEITAHFIERTFEIREHIILKHSIFFKKDQAIKAVWKYKWILHFYMGEDDQSLLGI